jgi:phosphoribosyl 1,2-cyclic phosphodiesterase
MELCVLGSGSSGNCSLVRIGPRAVMIDAGFGPRTLAQRMAFTGLQLADVHALLLTHLDSDHFNPSCFNTLAKYSIKLYCHRRHLEELYAHRSPTITQLDARRLHDLGLLIPFDDQPFAITLDIHHQLHVRPIVLHHDRQGTIGYRLETHEARIGYATDLGRVTKQLIERMIDVDLLAIESNYDPQKQLESERPAMLKNRIMGGSGHLSNDQTLEAVRKIFDRSNRKLRHLVLLHLSRQCNDPAIIRGLYLRHPDLANRLHLSTQNTPTPWLSAVTGPRQPLRGEQMTMFAN